MPQEDVTGTLPTLTFSSSSSSANSARNESLRLATTTSLEKADETQLGVNVVVEKGELAALPDKRGTSISRYLEHSFFSAYRRIFSVMFFANLTVLIVFVARTRGAPSLPDVANATSANLMITLLFRQENFVNLLYEIATCVPLPTPLSIRRRLALIFHYGGGHSGAGVAAVTWYFLYTVLATKEFAETREPAQIANVVTSYILVLMFFTILAGAHPYFRVRFHDRFEMMHRFAGWTALVTFWVHTVTAANIYAKRENVSLGSYLVHSANFWTFLVSTMCSALSWARLRRREVFPEILSDHAIRLHFQYTTMPPFYGLKVSDHPLTEWHAFATIPDDDGSGPKGFSVVVSNAGDWTKRTIQGPPKKLWVRGYPLHGLLYTSRLFRKIIVVATGSGIGPCLSLLYADVTPRRILWSTPHPETTYGPKIVNSVLKADPDAIIWNTRTQGRPDMVAMTWALVGESKAEAVFIISNPKVTRKVVLGMKSRGIPAYGAIFDS